MVNTKLGISLKSGSNGRWAGFYLADMLKIHWVYQISFPYQPIGPNADRKERKKLLSAEISWLFLYTHTYTYIKYFGGFPTDREINMCAKIILQFIITLLPSSLDFAYWTECSIVFVPEPRISSFVVKLGGKISRIRSQTI